MGHLIRCLALAEELLGRGVGVELVGDLGGLAWAQRQVAVRGIATIPAPADPAELADLVLGRGHRAAVLDGYAFAPGTGAALRGAGVAVLCVADGDFGTAQEADLFVDQNLGAERSPVVRGGRFLGGLDYALLRDVVRLRRPRQPPAPAPDDVAHPPRVLAVFGGTDAYDAARTVVPLILATGLAVQVTAVAGRPETAAALAALPRAPGQEVRPVAPVDDLPALAVGSDVVVSAAGTSVWELLCLGVATAVVCVTENQELGYREVVAAGLAAPAGRLARLREDEAARAEAGSALRVLLGDAGERARLAAAGWTRVDDRGRERVAEALLALVGS